MNKEEKISFLNQYKSKVIDWSKNHDNESRSFLNQNMSKARIEMANVGCFHTMTISPPPAIGGYVMQNVDPLITMFDPPYLMNLTTFVIDMIDQTIGVIEASPENNSDLVVVTNEPNFHTGYVFIAMPIDSSDPSLEDVLDSIKGVCAKLGLVAERVDEFQNNQKITDNILEGIRKAEYVIADLTYSKPNVYYEAGFAHALNKTPIYIAKEGTKFEFDVKDYPVIIFNSMKSLKQHLETRFLSLFEKR